MSEEKKNHPGGVRRVGEKDRKSRLDAGGPLIPPNQPSDVPPPTLPEDVPDPVEPSADVVSVEDSVMEGEAQASSASALDDDAAALLAEIETDIDADEADAVVPEEHQRFRRPPAPREPRAYDAPQDRFPPLPEERAAYAPVSPRPHVQAESLPPRKNRFLFNCLTLIFVLASCGLVAYFGYLWQNPYSAYNLFPPFTPPPVVVSQTFTPSMTFTPSETPTPIPTSTPEPTQTPTPLPTDTPEAAAAETTDEAGNAFQFALDGRQIYITNPEGRGGCGWSSIAGTVSDASGQALNEYQIRVLGDGVDETVISGSASGYGPGGFEVELGNEAVDAEYAVQLLDPGGTPVSDVLTVVTSSRCDWNISVLRFVQRGG